MGMSSFAIAQEPLSFDAAWARLSAASDTIAAGQANLDRAALSREASRALSGPRVDLIASYVRFDEPVELDALDFNPLNSFRDDPGGAGIIDLLGGDAAFTTALTNQDFGRVSLTAAWPLYTGGRIRAIQDAAVAQEKIAKESLTATRRLLFVELAAAYFGVVLAEQIVGIQQAVEDGLAKHLDNAKRLEEEGVIARVERLAVEAAHDKSTVATRSAERAREIAHLALRELVHAERDIDPTDTLFTNSQLPNVEAFVDAAIDNSTVLRTLDSQGEELESILRARRGRFHPELFLLADYQVAGDDSITGNLIPDWQIGVGVTVTLVDQVKRGKSISAAHRARDSVNRLSAATRRTLNVETSTLYQEAQSALEEHAGLASSLELAQENLKLREEAFLQGFSASAELVDAQIFLSAVQLERSAAAYKYVIKLAETLALAGETYRFQEFHQRAIAHNPRIGVIDER